MKTILLTSGNAVVENSAVIPPAVSIPDSAIVLPGKPLFVPDYAVGADIYFSPVIKISRLGKNIAPKFARRYFFEIAPLLRIVPKGDTAPQSAILTGADFMAAAGKFFPFPDTGMEFTFGGTLFLEPFSLRFTQEELALEHTVSLISRYMTLKNGDLISPLSRHLTLATPLREGLDATVGSDVKDAQTSEFRFR